MTRWGREDAAYELAGAHFQAFEKTGLRSELEAAIRAYRALWSSRADGAVANGLAIALWSRYEVTGGRPDLDEAITLLRDAVALNSGDTERLPSYLANLAGALRTRWRATRSGQDLADSVEANRRAVEITPPHHRRRSARLNNQADGMLAVHLHFGDGSALDSAITLFREAADTAEMGTGDIVNARSNLAEALRMKFFSTRDIGLVDEAVALARAVVPRAPTRALRARFQSNLALILLARYSATARRDDLREATTLVLRALKASPPGHSNRAERAAVLAECRRLTLAEAHGGNLVPHRFAPVRRSGPPLRSRRKAKLLRDATKDALQSTPHGHPTRADAVVRDAGVLAYFGDHAGALARLREAAEEPDYPPRARVEAARLWAYGELHEHNDQQALKAFRLAVELLPRTAPRHVTREDRQRALSALAGLASDAAACAIRAGDPELAVALLEQGRGVMLGQALDARTELTDLEDRHPDLAHRFEELRTALDTRESTSYLHGEPGLSGERRHALAQEWDTLVTEIRTLPGFADFLHPPRPEDLITTAAAHGPVIIVNVSALRCDALVIADGAITPVELPALTLEDLATRADRFRTDPSREIEATLHWLTETITTPLLPHLGTGRLWWIPTGPLTALPLHATVIDSVVSSYAPTLRSLAAVWRAKEVTTPDNPLIVAVPSAPGVPDLPGAKEEADNVASRFPAPTVLTATRARRELVLDALPHHRWAHFACHAASTDINGKARLVLWDHVEDPLTVDDIARLRLTDAEVAFLSACETSAAPPELTDESLHITGAFHMAGFHHVIGSLWPVGDRTSRLLASHYYDALATTRSPATALHQAIAHVRTTHPPDRWAPFVHVGG